MSGVHFHKRISTVFMDKRSLSSDRSDTYILPKTKIPFSSRIIDLRERKRSISFSSKYCENTFHALSMHYAFSEKKYIFIKNMSCDHYTGNITNFYIHIRKYYVRKVQKFLWKLHLIILLFYTREKKLSHIQTKIDRCTFLRISIIK